MELGILDYILVAIGAYYIIAIGIFQFGIKGNRVNKLVSRLGNIGARLIYALVGAIGIALVLTGIL